jgi:hypothetical protein
VVGEGKLTACSVSLGHRRWFFSHFFSDPLTLLCTSTLFAPDTSNLLQAISLALRRRSIAISAGGVLDHSKVEFEMEGNGRAGRVNSTGKERDSETGRVPHSSRFSKGAVFDFSGVSQYSQVFIQKY